MTAVLGRGDPVPHFVVRGIDGREVRYRTLWQQRNLVLITLPPSAAGDVDAALAAALESEGDRDTAFVVTRDEVQGLPPPSLVVADRWGEIVHAAQARDVRSLPAAAEILEWVEHVRHRCPECEGEVK